MEVIEAMAKIGNPNSVSDAGVAALAARSAVMGAFLNVKINAKDVADKGWIDGLIAQGERIQNNALTRETEILKIVGDKL